MPFPNDRPETLVARLVEMHQHLGHEPGKMTTLYGETTLIEISLLLAEAAREIRKWRDKNEPE